MDRLTFAIAAGAVTTIMMLAFLTLTDPADAQTGNPKQAVVFDMKVDLKCSDTEVWMQAGHGVYSVIGGPYDARDFAWRSWTQEDIILMVDRSEVGFLHLYDGVIDHNADTYIIKGLINPQYSVEGCGPAKITIRGACDSSSYQIILDGNQVSINDQDRFAVACYGN